ncbi:MAG: 7-cyano-7-deazaguanine synthase QueC [Planctomycetota bacterium]
MTGGRAVALLSGGMDSIVAAALLRDEGFALQTVAIDYGQRHRAELEAAAELATWLGAERHRVLRVDLRAIGGSALTDEIDVPTEGPGDAIPVTYVPARNTIFLALALGVAEVEQADAIVIGANAVDYSGYPDCRPAFLEAFERLAAVATKAGLEGRGPAIRAPLVDWPKAEIVRRGVALGVPFGRTISCYAADDEGRACGVCDACRLRRRGFEDAGVADPTRYAPKKTPKTPF